MRRGETEPEEPAQRIRHRQLLLHPGRWCLRGAGPERVRRPARRRTGCGVQLPSWQSEFGGRSVHHRFHHLHSSPSIYGHRHRAAGLFWRPCFANPPAVWMPINDEPIIEGQNSILHHADANWLYPMGRVRPGTTMPALQAKLSAALRQLSFHAPGLHRAWRRSRDSQAACRHSAGRRRHSEHAAGDGHGSRACS